MFFKPLFLTLLAIAIAFFPGPFPMHHIPIASQRIYYFSVTGNDQNDGTINHPFQSISKFNSLFLNPGDKVYFKCGDIFKGSMLIDSSKRGTRQNIISIDSYGNGKAIIDAGNENALTVYNTSFVKFSNLRLKGNGRKTGNTKDGMVITNCSNITVNNMDISGFQKSGFLIYSSVEIMAMLINAHDNGSAGITVEGDNGKKNSRNIRIFRCSAINNPGDPTKLDNHSGNGIVVGHCTNLLIDRCMATNNGWDMPRIGNGPVGIWAYEADSVIIQRCLSFRNKTSIGGADGGGFDFDGGVTNSIIQYCLSYENQGSGYCMFQYWGASPWYNNIIRYNISENDGLVSDSRAGAYVWNSSEDEKQFYNCDFYNNTIYNSKEAALSYSEKSKRKNFRFFNNIFVGKDSLIKGNKDADIFLANDWWSIRRGFNADRITNFTKWAKKYNQEMKSGKIIGLNIDPAFTHPDKASITNQDSLQHFSNYMIPKNSRLRTSGINLNNAYHIQTGDIDFFSKTAPVKGIGACF
ncbi:MAG TPA: right-handed parallel beta-helix repeat-containing protein [Puia sp.]|nr:right-handed parallel beta-helix repeat-containing protein [Puia sp.]